MDSKQSNDSTISTGLLITVFIIFMIILWKYADLFNSILGTILLIAVFAVDYNHRKGHIH